MRFILFIFVAAAIIYFASRLMSLVFRRTPASAGPTAVLQPAKMELDISVSDEGKTGMPLITIRSNAATLNIQELKQDSGAYIVSAEKTADNVAVITLEKKPEPR